MLEPDYDVTIFDLGPSLGALNRSVLLGCDYFTTPVAADLFSLYALENIGEWLSNWLEEYGDAFPRLAADNEIDERMIPPTLPISLGWSGYSVQQYVAKTSKGKIRGVQSYERYRTQIPERAARLQTFCAPDMTQSDLGIVPNMFSMVPLAQTAHAPIARLTPNDGVRGAQVTQQARYVDQLSEVFNRLKANVKL
jgi:hypothetical protein